MTDPSNSYSPQVYTKISITPHNRSHHCNPRLYSDAPIGAVGRSGPHQGHGARTFLTHTWRLSQIPRHVHFRLFIRRNQLPRVSIDPHESPAAPRGTPLAPPMRQQTRQLQPLLSADSSCASFTLYFSPPARPRTSITSRPHTPITVHHCCPAIQLTPDLDPTLSSKFLFVSPPNFLASPSSFQRHSTLTGLHGVAVVGDS